MPSVRSIYRKVQIVLDTAKSVKYDDIRGLVNGIYEFNMPSFVTRKYDRETDTMKYGPSIRVIRRTIRLCQTLGLIDSEGHLTSDGRKAIRKSQFDNIVRTGIQAILAEAGYDVDKMNKVITDMLHSTPVSLPTARALWNASKCHIALAKFSLLLTLLTQCGGASASQCKIYLHISIK
jgi:hypothetical protein